MLVIAAVGAVPFAMSLRRSREAVASWAALGFLLIGLLSALTSVAPDIGIFGLYDWGTGWLMWVACAGAFGIGLRLKREDLVWLFGGLVVGALVNSCIAVYQMIGRPGGALGLYAGVQADGLLSNPIHLEALLLGVIALVAFRSLRPVGEVVLLGISAALMLMGVALEFTDERLAVIVLPVILLALVWRGRLRGLALAGAVAAGYVIGYLGGGSGLGNRVTEGANSPGFTLRSDVWKAALHSVLHHPLIGAGPGEFQAGTGPFVGRAFALKLPGGGLFTDAHDFVIEVVVTTGVLGLACFLVWVGGSLARARNTMVLVALAGLAVEVVEPLNIAITCIVFLSLGACGVAELAAPPVVAQPRAHRAAAEPTPDAHDRLQPVGFVSMGILLVVALVLGITMIVGDAAYAHSPPHGYSITDAKRANSLWPYWPESAYALEDMDLYLRAESPSLLARPLYLLAARGVALQAASRAPFEPQGWTAVAATYAVEDQFAQADHYYLRALEYDPWNIPALQGLGLVAATAHDWTAAARWLNEEASVIPPGPEKAQVMGWLKDVARHAVPVP